MKAPKLLKIYKGLPKSLYFIFIARIINGMGNFVYPFLTMYLTNKLKFSASFAGRFILVAALLMVPGSLIGGKCSDIFGRKKTMIIFQSLGALCLIPCAYIKNAFAIPYFIAGASFFSSAAAPASGAMATDLTNSENRKNAFSLLYLGNNIGFSVGPMIAGFLYNNYLKWLFLGNAAAALMSMAILFFTVPETIPSSDKLKQGEQIKSLEKSEKGSLLGAIIKRPELVAFSLFSVVYSFVYSQYTFMLPMQVNLVFGNSGSKIFGSLMTVNGLVVVFFTTIIVSLTKKINPVLNTVFSGIFYAMGFGMFIFIKQYLLFAISTIIWTSGEILYSTNSGVYIANHTPMSHRGRFNAIFPIVSGAGYAIGPVLMGIYIDRFGMRNAWALIFILAVVSSVFMYILYLAERRKNK